MAYDCYLKLGDIEGESSDATLAGQIELFSINYGASNPFTPTSAGSMTAGRVSLSDLNVVKKYDKASPLLFLACASGEIFPTATITFRKAGGDSGQLVFYTIELEKVGVSSISTSGSSGGDDTPTESMSLSFLSVKHDYKPQKDDGTMDASITGGWNAGTNKKV